MQSLITLIVVALILIVVLGVAVAWRSVADRRTEKLLSAEHTKMNRGKMDQPGWVPQPWQHGSASSKTQTNKPE